MENGRKRSLCTILGVHIESKKPVCGYRPEDSVLIGGDKLVYILHVENRIVLRSTHGLLVCYSTLQHTCALKRSSIALIACTAHRALIAVVCQPKCRIKVGAMWPALTFLVITRAFALSDAPCYTPVSILIALYESASFPTTSVAISSFHALSTSHPLFNMASLVPVKQNATA